MNLNLKPNLVVVYPLAVAFLNSIVELLSWEEVAETHSSFSLPPGYQIATNLGTVASSGSGQVWRHSLVSSSSFLMRMDGSMNKFGAEVSLAGYSSVALQVGSWHDGRNLC